MLTVQFPGGVRVQYNTANFLLRCADAWQLYTEKNGDWVATIQLSAGVIVEAVPARAVMAPPLASWVDGLDMLLKLIEQGHGDQLPSCKAKDLKRALSRFNGRSKCWR
ncbi:MAG: hypothetical protein Q8K78_00390 [Planctomycetaceae bacterium]|nr:hypothetical protein [Planctomycetaceae bacterium]